MYFVVYAVVFNLCFCSFKNTVRKSYWIRIYVSWMAAHCWALQKC